MLVSKDVEFSQERFTAFRQQPSVQKQQIHVLEQVCSAKGTRWRPEYESWGTERERNKNREDTHHGGHDAGTPNPRFRDAACICSM
jgi:hypothetical protein